MIIVLQVAGCVAALIGVVALYYGIRVKEFSFGNTLILVGTISLCTGAILFALSVVALELRLVGRRLASGRPAQEPRPRTALPPFPGAGSGSEGPAFARDQAPPNAGGEPSMATSVAPPPWQEDSRARSDAPGEPEPVQAVPPPLPRPKRNLLFASSARKDRERLTRAGDPAQPPGAPPVPETGETAPAGFEGAWPRPDRTRGSEIPPQRRSSRAPATPADPGAGAVPGEPQSGVTVLKSGVVDGMAYSLYSDGSIEAQMPEGMMRFASIDDLRAHLDHRP